MKVLLFVTSLFFVAQSFSISTANASGAVSDEVLKEAFSNPKRFQFDDGGNIDFGHGFFKRRFNFAGQPQVCHQNNYLYAGEGTKCISSSAKYTCDEYATYDLLTEMVGSKFVCGDRDRGYYWGRCDNPTELKFNYGPKVKVSIYKTSKRDGKGKYGRIGYTYLTIPACDQ